jgi:hypothetical protein
MLDKDPAGQGHRICSECHLGHIRSRRITHVQWHNGQCVVVPNVWAEVCDFCGATDADNDQLWRLSQLLQYGNDLTRTSRNIHHTRAI